MKLKALSHYNGDKDTRFGDCILLYGDVTLIVYDCGHARHCEAIRSFLQGKPFITQVHIVVSHNDADHTDGVVGLLDWLAERSKYTVTVYTHQYLKHVDAILGKLWDKRRSRESLKESLLVEFDNITAIIEAAQRRGFSVKEALRGTCFGECEIVGPTEDEFTTVAAQAVDNHASDKIGEGHTEETVMNAASVQLKCKLDNAVTVLLCGDASPCYLHDLEQYHILHLPHHGQLADAKAIFEKLKDPYTKDYLVSDNTGSGATSGGSDDLVKYMKDEHYSPARNTKNKTIDLPEIGFGGASTIPGGEGVRLGALDFGRW